MKSCRHCGVGAKKQVLFCPNCGSRDAFEDPRNQTWLGKVKRRFWKDPVDRAIDNALQSMDRYGSIVTEGMLEQLAHRTGRRNEKVNDALALAYGIRGQADQFEGGDKQQALSAYNKAVEVASHKARWFTSRADVLRRLAFELQVFAQLEYSSFALRAIDTPLDELEKISETETPSGLYNKAIDDYGNALTDDPWYVPALIKRARLQKHLDRTDDATSDLNAAKAILDRALAVNPIDLDSRKERADVLEELGQTRDAAQDLKQVLAFTDEVWNLDSLKQRIKELEKKSD